MPGKDRFLNQNVRLNLWGWDSALQDALNLISILRWRDNLDYRFTGLRHWGFSCKQFIS